MSGSGQGRSARSDYLALYVTPSLIGSLRRATDRVSDSARDFVRYLASSPDLDLVRIRVRDLEHDLGHARDMLHDPHDPRSVFNENPDLDRDFARDLAIGFVSEIHLASEIVGHLARCYEIARDRGETQAELVSTLDRARDWVRDLALVAEERRELERDEARQGEARRIASSATGLLAVAARLLPVADRARYAEEYGTELWELAQAGAGRLAQLGYALRQVRNAPRTGLALRSPRRRGAAQ
jgi:hypothetical protein